MNRNNLDLTLSSLVFDGTHPSMYRDRVGVPEERHENYDERYDFHTLIYDCHYDEEWSEVVLICPMLMNFRRLVENATWKIDGVERPIKAIDSLSRGSVVRFHSPSNNPESIEVTHPLFSETLKINRQHTDIFAGKNTVYAISKDNKLEWIEDWLKFYVEEHGANAVVLFDNASTAYSMDELNDVMRGVKGIEASALVRAWFPFGPGGTSNTNFNSKFLHMTMVELGRRRLMSQARAVLNVDIDELAYSRTGESIFDATVNSPQGYVRMDGRWAFANPAPEGSFPRHADHMFVRSDGRPKCNRKYCVAPLGPLQGKPWLTHRILSRRDPTDPNFGFWHFRRVSNNWDYDREDFDSNLLEVDSRLTETMARVFPTTAAKAQAQLPDTTEPAPAVTAPAGALSNRTADNALIISSMKNEGPYILEWIAFHRVIGFHDFLIYTNDCSDGTDLILDRMAELGLLTHERNEVLKRGPQKSALKWAFSHDVTRKADWILVSDVDEFLNIKTGDGKLNDLLSATPGADVIPVTWRLFSNDNKVAFSDNLVIEDYTDAERPVSDGGQKRRFVKSIFRPHDAIERFGTHGPIHDQPLDKSPIWLAPGGREVDPETATRPENKFAYDVAQINHYATRAIDPYLVKKDRGRVNHFRQVMGLDYWNKMNQGGERDVSISRFIEETKAEMDRIAQDEILSKLLADSTQWHLKRIEELLKEPDYQDLRNTLLEQSDCTVS